MFVRATYTRGGGGGGSGGSASSGGWSGGDGTPAKLREMFPSLTLPAASAALAASSGNFLAAIDRLLRGDGAGEGSQGSSSGGSLDTL